MQREQQERIITLPLWRPPWNRRKMRRDFSPIEGASMGIVLHAPSLHTLQWMRPAKKPLPKTITIEAADYSKAAIMCGRRRCAPRCPTLSSQCDGHRRILAAFRDQLCGAARPGIRGPPAAIIALHLPVDYTGAGNPFPDPTRIGGIKIKWREKTAKVDDALLIRSACLIATRCFRMQPRPHQLIA